MRRHCTCAGVAPGYPQHESHCDLSHNGPTQAEVERRDEEESELRLHPDYLAELADEDDEWAGESTYWQDRAEAAGYDSMGLFGGDR